MVRRNKAALPRLVVLVLFVTLVSCGPTEDHGTKLRLSVNSWPGFGPLYIAESQGYFQQEDLDVEITVLEGGAERRAGLISGRLDVLGASLDDFAVTVDRGADAVAIGCADFSNGADGILVGGAVHTLQDLSQSEVAVEPGLPNHFFLLYVLDKNGLSIAPSNILPMKPDDAGAAFISGKIDAAVTWEPHLSRALKERHDAQVIARSSDYPEAILDLFVARKDWLDENPGAAERFRSAWDRAVDFLGSHHQEGTAILADRLALEPSDVEGILGGIEILESQQCVDLVGPQLRDLSDRVERIWREAGYLDSDPALSARFWFRP